MVILVEFVSYTRPMRGMLFPYAAALVRSRSDKGLLWLRFGVPDDIQRRKGSKGIELDETDRALLARHIPSQGQVYCVFSARPSDQLISFVRAVNPTVNVAYVPDLGTVRPAEPFQLDATTHRWCEFLGLPRFQSDCHYLHDTFDPDFCFVPANTLAAEIEPLPYLLFGAFCDHQRYFACTKVRHGCSFCLLASGSQRVPRLEPQRARRAVQAVVRLLWGRQKPIVRLVGSRVLKDLEVLVHAIVEVSPPGFRWLLDARVRDILKYFERLKRAVVMLGRARQVLGVSLVGVESFSRSELERFNKGVGPLENLEAIEKLLSLEREYAGAFSFSEFGGLSTILFTPWSTLEDVTRTIAIVRACGLERLTGKLLSSKLRLSQDLPITWLAASSGLLSEAFEDPALETASDALYEPEIPWRFADRRVYEISRLFVRLEGERKDALAQKVRRLVLETKKDKVSLALGLCDLCATGTHTAEALICEVEKTRLASHPDEVPPSIRSAACATSLQDLVREQIIETMLEMVRSGIKPVALLEALEQRDAQEILTRWPFPAAISMPAFQDPSLADIGFGADQGLVEQMAQSRDELRFAKGKHEEACLARIGRLLGYPECCSEAYSKSAERVLGGDSLLIVKLRLENPGPVDPVMSPFLVPHALPIPCSLLCPNAKALAEKALEVITRVWQDRGKNVLRSLENPWLMSTEHDGAAVEIIPDGPIEERFRYKAGRFTMAGWFSRAVSLANEMHVSEEELVLLKDGQPYLDLTGRTFLWWHQKAFQVGLWSLILKLRALSWQPPAGDMEDASVFICGGRASRLLLDWLLGLDAAPAQWRVIFAGLEGDEALALVGQMGGHLLLRIFPRAKGKKAWLECGDLAVSYCGSMPRAVEVLVREIGVKRLSQFTIAKICRAYARDPESYRGEKARQAIESAERLARKVGNSESAPQKQPKDS